MAVSVKLSPLGNQQLVDEFGNPAVGWYIETYAAGSSTRLATYTDETGTVTQSANVTMNALGLPETGKIWLIAGRPYKFKLYNAAGVLKDTVDSISGVNDSSETTDQWIASGVTPTYINATTFTLPGDQTTDFHAQRKLQFTATAGSVYGEIATSVYGTLTTVTMTMDGTSALDSGLSAVNLSLLRADHLASPGGTGTFIQSGTGAVFRTPQNKMRESVSVKDFGAVGDGSTDDYAAIIAAYNAVSAGARIYVPSGTYKFLTAPVFGTKRVSWIGDGARQSIFNYAGANTTNDCFTWGDGISEVNGIRIEGIGFASSTVMTAGAAVRFKLLSRSVLLDVLFNHQDGDSNFYHGAWFDGCDFVTVDGYQARAQQDGIRVNGAPGSATVGARADLFMQNGKIGKCTVGLHIGGAFGGLYVDATDIIVNLTNVLIDKTINAFGNNRECFFGPGCLIDSAGSSALPFSGINLDIQDSSGFIFFSSPWIASASTLIRIGSGFTGNLKLDGGLLYNALNSFGGSGNGIEIGNVAAQVQVNGTRLKNIDGTAFTCSAGVTTFTDIVNVIYESDVAAKYDANVRPLPIVTKGRHISGGGDATFACSVDSNPSQTFYQGGNYGGATAIGYFGNNASNGWLEFAKSRGVTPGAHGIITSGDSIGAINFSASDGVSFVSTARILVKNTGTPAVGDIASRMIFSTRPVGGAITERVWILETGNFAPVSDNSISCGQSGLAWSNTYSRNFRPGTGTATWTSGAGTPEAVITAVVGSLYTRTDGGAATTLYVKESGAGNTGWIAK